MRIKLSPEELLRRDRASKLKWYYANKGKRKEIDRAIQRRLYYAHPERHREKYYRMTYGLNLEQVESLKASQNYTCAICKKPLPINLKHIHVDHNHTTGRIRGILCQRCNLGIGKTHERIETIEAAIVYLQNNGGGK